MIKNFTLQESGFFWKGREYDAISIKHLAFIRVRTKHSVNLVATGETERVSLEIYMDGNIKVVIGIDSNVLFTGKRDIMSEMSDLEDAYDYLATITFQQRIAPYLMQIQTKRYFEFDECLFYPRDKIVYRGQDFRLNDSTFLKGYGYIELRNKSFGALEKIKRELPFRKIPQFSTITDRDVIFTLLDKYMNLRWN